jgi:hypothetical protein
MGFNFNYSNNPKPTILQYIATGILVTTLVSSLSRCTKIPENDIDYGFVKSIDFLNEHTNIVPPIIPEYIIQDSNLLNIKINSDLNTSINKYRKQQGYNKPNKNQIVKKIIQLPPDNSYAQRMLGGVYQICNNISPTCPKDNEVPLPSEKFKSLPKVFLKTP